MPEPGHLTQRNPQVPVDRLLAGLVPPRHFADATFTGYQPDPAHPSQRAALERLTAVADRLARPPATRWWSRRSPQPDAVYLDGGFGVGKTHLLAALAHSVGPGRAAYGTFVEYTHLVGALGFADTVAALAERTLVCLDEFELDDPGDTLLMSRLLRELADAGVTLAATSNTLPESLGEGRFAAEDFLREIQALAARFTVVRIDGPDYRHRAGSGPDVVVSDATATQLAAGTPGATCDTLSDLLEHLRQVHPSRYGAMLDGVTMVALTGVRPVPDQADALRLVVLVDRLYDGDIPVVLGGAAAALFGEELLRGGYRKKYLRALSRLRALTAAAADEGADPGAGRPVSRSRQ